MLIINKGFVVIREAINNDIKIEVIPGPSASITAMVLSNFDTFFHFVGFLKPKRIQRQNQITK